MRKMAVLFAALALVLLAAACSATSGGTGSGKGDGQGLELPTVGDLPAGPELQAPAIALAGWKGSDVASVCLDVNVAKDVDAGMRQGAREATRLKLTTHQLIESMLIGMGIQVVDKGCDATMTVDLSGSTVGATYEDWGYCHTDARYAVTMTLEGEGPTVSRSFEVPAESPPYMLSLSSCGFSATGAYANTYSEWMPQFVGALGEVWGERPAVVSAMLEAWEGPKFKLDESFRAMGDELPILLASLLDDPNADTYQVAFALGKLGDRAESVVPSLIRMLEAAPGGDRSTISEALTKITGERRLSSVNDWLGWWGEQAG